MPKRASKLLFAAALLLLATGARWCWLKSAAIAAAQASVRPQRDGEHDFDFYVGKWHLHNRRLLRPLTGSNQWVEFEGTSVARRMWDGRANVDEFEADTPSGHMEGMTVRLYSPQTHEWSIYWADGKGGDLSMPPTVGRFVNGRGEFYDHEAIGGRPVYVRFLWQVESPRKCHWEQAFSVDDGKTWETNWTIDSTQMEGPAL